MRIKCYCELYTGAGMEPKKNQMIQNLMERKLFPAVYVLTLPAGEKNQLEFFSSLELRQPAYDEKEVFVVGIAGSYDEAVYLIETIAEEVLEKTKTTNIRAFILENQRAFEKGMK